METKSRSSVEEVKILLIIKPEGASHREAILSQIQEAGCRVVTSEPPFIASDAILHGHYAGIGQLKKRLTEKGIPQVYDAIIAHMKSGPVEPIIIGVPVSFAAFDLDENGNQRENPDPIVGFRNKVIGATDPRKAADGTIRANFGWVDDGEIRNVVHASANQEEADQEIALWFGCFQ